MTCAHVLGILDAEPFIDVPAEQRARAVRHARECASCAEALERAAAIATALRAMPVRGAPADFAASTNARIARLGDEPAALPRGAGLATRLRVPLGTTVGGLITAAALLSASGPSATMKGM